MSSSDPGKRVREYPPRMRSRSRSRSRRGRYEPAPDCLSRVRLGAQLQRAIARRRSRVELLVPRAASGRSQARARASTAGRCRRGSPDGRRTAALRRTGLAKPPSSSRNATAAARPPVGQPLGPGRGGVGQQIERVIVGRTARPAQDARRDRVASVSSQPRASYPARSARRRELAVRITPEISGEQPRRRRRVDEARRPRARSRARKADLQRRHGAQYGTRRGGDPRLLPANGCTDTRRRARLSSTTSVGQRLEPLGCPPAHPRHHASRRTDRHRRAGTRAGPRASAEAGRPRARCAAPSTPDAARAGPSSSVEIGTTLQRGPASSKIASASSAHVASPSAAMCQIPPGSATISRVAARQVADVGGRAALVVDDAHLVPLGPEAKHRAHEVVASPAEEPGAPDDPAVPHLALAEELRAPVRAERRRLVGLDVRRALRAVEDVVGGEVDDRRAERGHVPRPLDVDAERACLVGLGAVHVRPGRRVQHEPGLVSEGDRLRHVELVPRARIGVGEGLPQRRPELAARPGYEDASRCERIGLSVLHRCLTRGSSQGIPCSSGSAGSYSRVTW